MILTWTAGKLSPGWSREIARWSNNAPIGRQLPRLPVELEGSEGYGCGLKRVGAVT